jgi:hypothetical protein
MGSVKDELVHHALRAVNEAALRAVVDAVLRAVVETVLLAAGEADSCVVGEAALRAAALARDTGSAMSRPK